MLYYKGKGVVKFCGATVPKGSETPADEADIREFNTGIAGSDQVTMRYRE